MSSVMAPGGGYPPNGQFPWLGLLNHSLSVRHCLFHVETSFQCWNHLICTVMNRLDWKWHRCEYYIVTWELRYCTTVIMQYCWSRYIFVIISSISHQYARVCSSAKCVFGVRQLSTGFKCTKLLHKMGWDGDGGARLWIRLVFCDMHSHKKT